MTILEYILLFVAVLAGGAAAVVTRKRYPGIINLVLAFSGAFILAVAVLHLIPELYSAGVSGVGVFVLLGFVIQIVLDGYSRGVEHGHIHAAHKPTFGFAASVMVGLCLHALLEGIPLAEQAHLHDDGHYHAHGPLFYGIILHKAPASFALGLLLILSGYTQRVVWACLLLFASMSPLGAFLSESVLSHMSLHARSVVMAVVIGSFLHIATTILFEVGSGERHRLKYGRLIVIVVGMGLAWLAVG